jgi:glycine/D-amino acid oxidase-like deaminating enzyme
MAIESGLYHSGHYDRSRPVGSYWEATGGGPAAPEGVGRLRADLEAEIAIVGGGYTGLSAAYHLAREHGVRAVVLEAGPIGWGASGRNGGFCGLGGSKLGYGAMAQRWGVPEAARFFAAQKAGVALVRALAADEGIDLEVAGEGEHYLAHRTSRWHELENAAATAQRLFGERWPLWRKAELEERLLRSPEAQGCLVVPHYFGLHPLRYVRGLARAAAARGAAVHADTPVLAWQRAGGRHRLATPGGTVTAGRVLFATNGYTPEGLDPLLNGRLLPALSSILVTRPLTPAEQAAQGWTRPALVADSRRLLFYIRLLGDGRLLFGARGGLDASPGAFAARQAWMERRLGQKFPAWHGVPVEFAWWGLVCLARDLLPHLGWLDESRTTLGAWAYHGGGVAFATMFGRAAAARLAGREPDPPLPAFLLTAPPRFPAPGLRLLALRAAYLGYGLRDEWL